MEPLQEDDHPAGGLDQFTPAKLLHSPYSAVVRWAAVTGHGCPVIALRRDHEARPRSRRAALYAPRLECSAGHGHATEHNRTLTHVDIRLPSAYGYLQFAR